MYDPYQVAEARAWGADCILIIMAAVDDAAAQELEDSRVRASAWTCCSRCTTSASSSARLRLRSRLIGINNRNLKTFETTLDDQPSGSRRRIPRRPHRRRRKRHLHARRSRRVWRGVGISTFLVGESLMRAARRRGRDARAARPRAAHARRRGVSDGARAQAHPSRPGRRGPHGRRLGQGRDRARRRRRRPRRDDARRRSISCSRATPRRATCSAPRASPASWRRRRRTS